MDSTPPLLRHLDTLYPLARVLAGPGAPKLLTDVFERAAAVPPAERPEDERAWLIQVLTTLHDEADGTYSTDEGEDGDPSFRETVARATAERKLPVAFAACSPHERFLLALDTLENHPSTVLGTALDLSTEDAQAVLDEARSSLRAALRDVLNGPERMLMDVALPESTLQSLLRDLITDRFDEPSSSLRTSLSSLLEDARAEQESPDSSDQPESSTSEVSPGLRRVGVGVLVLLLVGGALLGLYYMNGPSGGSSPTLGAFTSEYATGLSPSVRPSTTQEAEQYIQSNWGRRLTIPALRNAPLQGVSSLVLDSVDVPVLLYQDTTNQRPIAVGAYSYALLDRLAPRVSVPDSVWTGLANAGPPLLHQSEGRPVVMWRTRDDLFVAVGPQTQSPQALREQVTP